MGIEKKMAVTYYSLGLSQVFRFARGKQDLIFTITVIESIFVCHVIIRCFDVSSGVAQKIKLIFNYKILTFV